MNQSYQSTCCRIIISNTREFIPCHIISFLKRAVRFDFLWHNLKIRRWRLRRAAIFISASPVNNCRLRFICKQASISCGFWRVNLVPRAVGTEVLLARKTNCWVTIWPNRRWAHPLRTYRRSSHSHTHTLHLFIEELSSNVAFSCLNLEIPKIETLPKRMSLFYCLYSHSILRSNRSGKEFVKKKKKLEINIFWWGNRDKSFVLSVLPLSPSFLIFGPNLFLPWGQSLLSSHLCSSNLDFGINFTRGTDVCSFLKRDQIN